MACPYFFPFAAFNDSAWAVPPRLPLGDAYTGECHAHAAPITPDESTLRQFCNRGYGRGGCECFPETAPCDAIRFHVAGQEKSTLTIQYVFEKNCWPVRHGRLEYASGTIVSSGEPILELQAILERQAAAFAESYFRRAG